MNATARTRAIERLLRKARGRIEGLLRQRQIRELRSLAAQCGIQIWIVGGALRDALCGRTLGEVDVAASHGCQGLIAAMEAAGLGTAVRLSEASPRVYRIAAVRDIDCAEIEGGSIQADLARRDFTVNAIAFDPISRRWIDPFRGVEDLARRRLRMIAHGNLVDDPLRTLRAARFLATHGLRSDGPTFHAVRQVAPLLRDIAPERTRVELQKLLEVPQAQAAVDMLLHARLFGPALGLDPKTPLRRALLTRMDLPAISRQPPRERALLRLALFAAALRFSPERAAQWLSSRRFSREEAGGVAALLTLVDQARRLRNSREEWGWIRDAGQRRRDLALLLLVLVEPGEAARAGRIHRRRPAATRFHLSGRDVLAWLSIEPGPRVGELLREVEIEVMRGAIRSRAAARHWLLENSS